jgi:hypothetical protein
LFDEQEDSLDAHKMVVIFEDVQECMNISVDIHGGVDKPIGTISFENVLRTEDTEKEQRKLMKEACHFVLTHQKEMFSHMYYDSIECYMEKCWHRGRPRDQRYNIAPTKP